MRGRSSLKEGVGLALLAVRKRRRVRRARSRPFIVCWYCGWFVWRFVWRFVFGKEGSSCGK